MNKKNYTKMRGAYALLIFLFISHIFSSFSSAPPFGRTGAPGESTCLSCHGGNNAQGLDGSIQITGLPAEVMPNTNYRVTVNVANPNGLSLAAGMQMVAIDSGNQNAGSFTNPSNGGGVITSNGREYLGHSPAQAYDANRISSWSVDWTSPADPDPNVTFYAVGNITDMDSFSNTANDLIVFETQSTEVVGNVVVELPDLTASNITEFEGTFAPDEVVEFSWDLNNLGNVVATNEYRIVMYLSDDQVFSADDVAVGEVPTGNTFPGTIAGVPGAIRIPLNAPDGTYYIHLFVDNDNTVEESDEDNNIFTSSTTIMVGEVIVVDPLVLNAVTEVACDGTGTIGIAATGGVLPYTYDWSTGASSAQITVTESGTYSVTVEDSANNVVTSLVQIAIPDALTAEALIVENPGCDSPGTVEIVITGGTTGYTVLWSDGSTDLINDQLLAGDFEATVTDAAGCTAIAAISLDANDALQVTSTLTQLSCPGLDVGSIALEVTGGSGNYIYAWSNGATTSTISNLSAGNFMVTINDGGDCDAIRSFTITAINPIELISDVQDVTCSGDSDGAINVLATGGTGPYTYAWSNGEMTNNIDGLSGGEYTLTLTDDNNCVVVSVYDLDEAELLTVTLEGSVLNCFGDADGSVEIVEITGGVQPYAFTSLQGGLSAGSYTVTATDANGCVTEATAEVVGAEEIQIQGNVSVTADGGSIDISVVGGAGDYVYIWTNGETTEDISDLIPGTYMVVVTDSNGCIVSQEFEIISTSIPAISELLAWEIYPTAVNDNLNVSVSLSDPVSLRIQVVSLDGTFIEAPVSGFSYFGSQQKTTVDVSSLSDGMYLLILESERGREVKRFVKQ